MLNKITILTLIITTLTITPTFAQTELSIGKKLSPAQLSKLKGFNLKLGDQSFKVITEQQNIKAKQIKGTTTNARSKTFIANTNGVLGVSENLILIARVPPNQVRLVAQNIIHAAISTKFYDHLEVSSLQFQTFNQTITAYNELVKLFPQAEVSIPIKFSEPSPR